LQEWARKLDATPQQVKDAVKAVGPSADDVEMHLKGVRSTTNSEETRRAGRCGGMDSRPRRDEAAARHAPRGRARSHRGPRRLSPAACRRTGMTLSRPSMRSAGLGARLPPPPLPDAPRPPPPEPPARLP